MNNPKIKELIEAATQKKGYVVEKLTKNILAAKVNDLIQEKKKEIKLG